MLGALSRGEAGRRAISGREVEQVAGLIGVIENSKVPEDTSVSVLELDVFAGLDVRPVSKTVGSEPVVAPSAMEIKTGRMFQGYVSNQQASNGS